MRTMVAAAVAGALVLAACSSESADTDATTTTSTADAGEAGPSTTAGGVYLVQDAGPATLAAQGEDYSLVLAEVSPTTVVFTGEPDPRAMTAATADTVDALDDTDAEHEAALSWTAPEGTGTLVVTIVSGTYDEASRTLTYVVRPTDPSEASSTTIADHAAARGAATGSPDEVAATLPAGVTSSTLFVDPLGQDQAEANCELTVVNESPFDGQVDSIDPDDSGGMVDWDTPLRAEQPLPAGGSISASSGDSAWDCHATVDLGFTDADGNFYGVVLTLRDPVFSRSTWSCVGPPELACDVEADDKGQPLAMTVTIRA